jgi:hypothetical protein
MSDDAHKKQSDASADAENCSNCRLFFAPQALCCASHPVAMMVGLQPVPGAVQRPGQPPPMIPKIDSFFPQTRPDMWCGDYQRGTHPSHPVDVKPPLIDAATLASGLAGLETEGSA